jgi:hypothetical protein
MHRQACEDQRLGITLVFLHAVSTWSGQKYPDRCGRVITQPLTQPLTW